MKQGRFTAWQHQVEGCRAVAAARRRGERRSLLVMASGLGKTVTSGFDFSSFYRSYPGARVLFLAHQNDIVEQAEGEFRQMYDGTMQYGFFNGHQKDTQAQATFATFQSMNNVLFGKRKQSKRPFGRRHFDYVIVDESHHGPAPTYKRVIDYFRPRFMLAITATPDRMDMANIRDMFGQEVYSLDLAEALARGLLTKVDYRIMADEIVDKGKIKLPPHLISIQKLNRIFFLRKRDTEIIKVILEKAGAVKDPRGIVFTASIRHAESFAKILPGSVAIHSGLSKKERESRMVLVRSGIIRFAVTVDQFNEGIDIPEANVLVFLRSTQSRTVFYQQLGRGLRKIRGKSSVLVLDFVANCERLMFLEQFNRDVQSKRRFGRKEKKHHKTFDVSWGRVVFEEKLTEILGLLRKMEYGLTPEQLIRYLQDFYRKHGRSPLAKELNASMGMPSQSTYREYFGGLTQAYQEAQIPPPLRPRYPKTNDEVLDLLVAFYKQHGTAPKTCELGWHRGLPSASTCELRFGTLVRAFKLAGIPVDSHRRTQIPLTRSFDDEQILEKLRQLHRRKKGGIRSYRDMRIKGTTPNVQTLINRFGSVANALTRAGIPIPPSFNPTPTDEELIARIRRFYLQYGRAPRTSEVKASAGLFGNKLLRKLGGLIAVCKKAGIPKSTMSVYQVGAAKSRTQRGKKKEKGM